MTPCAGFSQVKGTTEGGKEVELYPDGTWKYANQESGGKGPASSGFKKPSFASRRLELLKGKASLWTDPAKWKQQPNEAPGEFQFSHSTGDAFAKIIAERTSIPLASIRAVALQNYLKHGDAAVLSEETRIVNDTGVLCLKIDGTVDGIPFRCLNYYYCGEIGCIQISTWTGSNLFREYEQDLQDFLNGFCVSTQGRASTFPEDLPQQVKIDPPGVRTKAIAEWAATLKNENTKRMAEETLPYSAVLETNAWVLLDTCSRIKAERIVAPWQISSTDELFSTRAQCKQLTQAGASVQRSLTEFMEAGKLALIRHGSTKAEQEAVLKNNEAANTITREWALKACEAGKAGEKALNAKLEGKPQQDLNELGEDFRLRWNEMLETYNTIVKMRTGPPPL